MRESSRLFWALLLAAAFCACAGRRIKCLPRESELECATRIQCPPKYLNNLGKCREFYFIMGCTETMTIKGCWDKMMKNLEEIGL